MAKIVRPGFTWARGWRHLVGADDTYELSRVRLPFHGIVGRRCAGVHHLGNQLHQEREFSVPGRGGASSGHCTQ